MRIKRIIVLAIPVLALVAGVGFFTLARPVWQRAADSGPRGSVPLLQIEENTDRVMAESGPEGHCELRFENPADRPVTVAIEAKSCQCAHVLLCVAPESWKGLERQEFLKRATDPALAWQALEPGGERFTVPAHAVGLVRLTWKAEKVGDHLFWVGFGLDDGVDRGPQRLEVPIRFIEPVHVRAEDEPNSREVDVGRLNAGEERMTRLLCYSTTREQFTLTPAPGGDPCILYGPLQPLTQEELQALSEKAGTTARAGYRVTVTVREQAGDARLDIGPFRRRVAWETNVFPGHEVSAHVTGTVQGEVWLADSAGKAFVDLGTISPAAPKPLVFTLEGRDPQLQLTVDEEKSLEFLQVELLAGKEGRAAGSGKNWQVRVQCRTDALFHGLFPDPERPGFDSAIACSAVFLVSRQGQAAAPARRLFVPVRGTVKMR